VLLAKQAVPIVLTPRILVIYFTFTLPECRYNDCIFAKIRKFQKGAFNFKQVLGDRALFLAYVRRKWSGWKTSDEFFGGMSIALHLLHQLEDLKVGMCFFTRFLEFF
jgi:hypothetical protein